MQKKAYPVIGMTKSRNVFSLVTSINSPNPCAACSLVSYEPLIKPLKYIQYSIASEDMIFFVLMN